MDMLHNKWVWIGGASLLVLLLLMGRGGGNSGASAGLASQSIATNANVALGGIDANLQGLQMQVGAQEEMQQIALQGSLFSQVFSFFTNLSSNAAASNAVASQVVMNDSNNYAAIQINRDNNATAVTINHNATEIQSKYIDMLPTLMTIDGTNRQALATIAADEAKVLSGDQVTIAETNAGASVDMANSQAMAASYMPRANSPTGLQQIAGGLPLLGQLFQGMNTPIAAGSILGNIFGGGAAGGVTAAAAPIGGYTAAVGADGIASAAPLLLAAAA